MDQASLKSSDALLVVDVQNDFCPGGALAVEGGDRVVPVLNRWIKAAEAAGTRIIASRDWHPAGHVSFHEQGGPWPPHCVEHTPGAEFHAALALPQNVQIVSKGTNLQKEAYSAFEGTDLAERLKQQAVQRFWIGGLTLEYCVCQTTLDGLRMGFQVHVLLDATRAINANPGDDRRALDEIRRAGAVFEGELDHE